MANGDPQDIYFQTTTDNSAGALSGLGAYGQALGTSSTVLPSLTGSAGSSLAWQQQPITWDQIGKSPTSRVDCVETDVRPRALIRVPHGQPTPEPYTEVHRHFNHVQWVDDVVIEDERSPWPHRPGNEMMTYSGFEAYEKALQEHFIRVMAGPPEPEPDPLAQFKMTMSPLTSGYIGGPSVAAQQALTQLQRFQQQKLETARQQQWTDFVKKQIEEKINTDPSWGSSLSEWLRGRWGSK